MYSNRAENYPADYQVRLRVVLLGSGELTGCPVRHVTVVRLL